VSSNKKDNNRRNRRRNKGGQAKKKQEFQPTLHEMLPCSVCGEPIKDMTSAISTVDNDDPAHFDCVVSQLNKREVLSEQEKIVYLGSGHFAVVELSEYNKRSLNIIRKIEPLSKDSREQWRKKMRQELKA
jgi:hypothetical protein